MNTGAPWPTPSEADARVLRMQTKLHQWATDDRSRRFVDLFNLVADPAFLQVAWRRVRGNRGARSAGIDGQTASSIEAGRGEAAFLADLRVDLRARTFRPVAVRERMEPGWHTYWTNPGDSGEPTSIEWALAEGVKAWPILWPLPHVIPVGPLVEYGYDDEVLLLTEIEVPANAAGSVTLAAKVSYLVCKDICVPEDTRVELTLPNHSNGR